MEGVREFGGEVDTWRRDGLLTRALEEARSIDLLQNRSYIFGEYPESILTS